MVTLCYDPCQRKTKGHFESSGHGPTVGGTVCDIDFELEDLFLHILFVEKEKKNLFALKSAR